MSRPRFDILWLRTAIINAITASVALGLALNRRRNPELPACEWPPERTAPFVEIIIPARDEERNIAPQFETLLAQHYPQGRWRVTVVDDGSTDRTRELVESMAREHSSLRLVRVGNLPPGWTGKNHAMYQGYLAASPKAEYLLFVDADTRHLHLMLPSVVLRAEQTNADLLSLVIRVGMYTFWERLLIPQVGELYTLLVGTMDSVNRQGIAARAAPANGQFMLMRPQAYQEAISIPEVRADVAEDRAIAAALKRSGKMVRLEYGRHLVRSRVYSSLGEMWEGYTKTIFWASGHDVWKATTVALALAFYAYAPLVTLLRAVRRRNAIERRKAIYHGLAELLPMITLRVAVCMQMGVPARYALTYPLAVAMGDVLLLYSLWRVVTGRGVRWKGRTYK